MNVTQLLIGDSFRWRAADRNPVTLTQPKPEVRHVNVGGKRVPFVRHGKPIVFFPPSCPGMVHVSTSSGVVCVHRDTSVIPDVLVGA